MLKRRIEADMSTKVKLLSFVLLYVYVCVCVHHFLTVFAHPNGAPTSTCRNMKPVHKGTKPIPKAEGFNLLIFKFNITLKSLNVYDYSKPWKLMSLLTGTQPCESGVLGFVRQGQGLP